MRRSFRLIAIVLVLCFAFCALNCYGSYTLFHKIHRWNGTIGNGFVKSLVHLLLWIIPVYEVCLIIDWLLLNTLEFWTGSNPLAMAPGETETQIVMANGETYEITATMNRFDIRQMSGVNAGYTVALVYDPESLSWYIETQSQSVNVARMEQDGKDAANFVFPDGRTERLAFQ